MRGSMSLSKYMVVTEKAMVMAETEMLTSAKELLVGSVRNA